MCIVRTCCCGCNLRQGTIGIIITDGIFFGIQLFYTILLTTVLQIVDDNTDVDLGLLKAIIWIAMIPNTGRFTFGLVSSCSGFAPKNRFIHFLGHLISDILSVIFAVVIWAISPINAGTVVVSAIFWLLFAYFDWILWSFYKEDEIMKTEKAQNPSQIIVVQQGQPVQGQMVQQTPMMQQPMAYGAGQPMIGQPMHGQPMAGQPMGVQPMAGQPMAAQPIQQKEVD